MMVPGCFQNSVEINERVKNNVNILLKSLNRENFKVILYVDINNYKYYIFRKNLIFIVVLHSVEKYNITIFLIHIRML